VIFTLAGEGLIDIAVATRLAEHAGHTIRRTFPQQGKSRLDRQLRGFNNAARFEPWLVLRDLDTDAPCAATLVRQLLPEPSRYMLFRIAVREVESWLLADAQAFADFFSVPATAIPEKPDELTDPKGTLINVVASSTSASMRREILPGDVTRKVGPGYTAKVIEFVDAHWNIARARQASSSLDRCVAALANLTV
jgi:hypothetical protein